MSLPGTQREVQSPIRRKLTLLDLPYDVIDIIFSKVDFRHHRYLRGVSKKLRQLHNCHIMHKYNQYVARQVKQRESPEDQNLGLMLKIMDGTARNFLQAGLESQYASNILYFFEVNPRTSPRTSPSLIYDYLFSLQLGLEDPLFSDDDSSRSSVRDLRIIYTIALFRLLRKFHNFRIVESDMNIMHWQLVVELPRVFLGVMDERNVNFRNSNRQRRIGLLSILAEMLFYVKGNQSFGGFKDTGNVVFTYGFQSGDRTKRKPRLMIKCLVVASKKILNLLQDVITGKDVTKKSVHVPKDAVFRARLEVNSKPEKRFFDYGTLHINIFHDKETVT